MLEWNELSLAVPAGGRWVEAVSKVSLALAPGRALGLVGESGCGKTLTTLAALRLTDHLGVRRTGGDVRLDGRSIFAMSEQELLAVRGGEIAMVFQEPMTALNPVFTIGAQITDVIRRHLGVSKARAREIARERLAEVGLAPPDAVLMSYPDALSGGMRQRALIAMALAAQPRFLLADEPTTALDVSVQKRIVLLLGELQRRHRLGLLLVTHDFGLVAELCDEVAVIYAGQIVEQAEAEAIFDRPRHPYTQALLACRPEAHQRGELPAPIPGQAPRVGKWPQGCRFAPRCRYAEARCSAPPPWREVEDGHFVRCVREDAA
ncbi:MAG: ABC transporter ATP-binding protein [Zetaproteobacteria bacterium]|nr:MAG: ABC transporter ATP-binding protein [Zetaproteobacteria bacterium]